VIIPLFNKSYDWSKAYWILGYILAVILLSLDGTLQEKYVMDTHDGSLINKVSFAFYTSICQVVTLIVMFWVEYVFGYTDHPLNAFVESIKIFSLDNVWSFVILELFIIDCLALYLITVHLNSISTNYNMILTNLTNQSVAIFFIIFPNLNNGIQYPILITVCSLIINIISVLLWMKGERNKTISFVDSTNEIDLIIQ
jgi:Na+/H+-translocating membrane pyrophosphatase